MVGVWAKTFRGSPSQVSSARRFVAYQLDGSRWRDDAVVVVSELFTNAVRHTRSGDPGGLVVVQVSRWLRGVRIAVTDQGSEQTPAIPRLDPDADLPEGGMGLLTVDGLAQLNWHDDRGGRTVYATFGVAPFPRYGIAARHDPDGAAVPA